MQVTVEKVNGIDHTIVWHDVTKEDVAKGFKATDWFESIVSDGKCSYLIVDEKLTATALPPVPNKRGVDEDFIRLKATYRSYGIIIQEDTSPNGWIITHGTYEGYNVTIAITENEECK